MDLQTLASAKKYTDKSLDGAGALKGAPCTIQSIVDITGGHKVTFAWENKEGQTQTSDLNVMDGANGAPGSDGAPGPTGIGISSVYISNTNHLMVTYTNGNTQDAGLLPVGQDGNNTSY